MAISSKKHLPKIYAAGIFAGAVFIGALVVPLILQQSAAARIIQATKKDDLSDMASHRAVYDFKMITVESGAGISGIRGRMYYQQDDVCDAFATEHRFNAEYQYPERPAVVTTSQYSSWESKTGNQFYFNSDRQENGILSEQLRGTIQKTEGQNDQAHYTRPEDISYDLPQGYYLPVQHTHEIIKRARAGETFFNAVIFDGTDADGPVEINTFIGKKAAPEEIAALAAKAAKPMPVEGDNTAASDKMPKTIDTSLLVQDAWHIRMAVFPLKNKDDMLPSYEMDMLLHANGVASDVVVDYHSFKVAQTLTALEPVKNKKCP